LTLAVKEQVVVKRSIAKTDNSVAARIVNDMLIYSSTVLFNSSNTRR
jgi:hypothetical protein